jgi:hypothetical protein
MEENYKGKRIFYCGKYLNLKNKELHKLYYSENSFAVII